MKINCLKTPKTLFKYKLLIIILFLTITTAFFIIGYFNKITHKTISSTARAPFICMLANANNLYYVYENKFYRYNSNNSFITYIGKLPNSPIATLVSDGINIYYSDGLSIYSYNSKTGKYALTFKDSSIKDIHLFAAKEQNVYYLCNNSNSNTTNCIYAYSIKSKKNKQLVEEKLNIYEAKSSDSIIYFLTSNGISTYENGVIKLFYKSNKIQKFLFCKNKLYMMLNENNILKIYKLYNNKISLENNNIINRDIFISNDNGIFIVGQQKNSIEDYLIMINNGTEKKYNLFNNTKIVLNNDYLYSYSFPNHITCLYFKDESTKTFNIY